MSGSDVYGDDMEELPDFDDPALRDLRADVQAAFSTRPPVASPALVELFEAAPRPHRSTSMRRVLGQLVAATTVVVAATGGLAVAGALPAPVQDLVSDTAGTVGVDVPDSEEPPSSEVPEGSTTTTVEEPATEPATAADDPAAADEDHESDDADDDATDAAANHGAEVSAVARDKSLHGCEHGRAVSSVASGKVNPKPCPHTDEGEDPDAAATAPTTVAEAPAAAAEPEPAPAEAPKANKGTSNGKGRGHARQGR
jgi:hypothetical protein